MMDRRTMLASFGGAMACGLAAATANAAEPYVIPEAHMPRFVKIREGFAPYEVHVFPQEFGLYWTLPDQRAIRYAVGIGKPGLYEAGEFFVGAKKEWPSWKPTEDMVERDPASYAQYAEDGMPGGPQNPLGARALYLFQPRRGDTYLRIHGTNDPRTIGHAVSNGCARLVNSHIVDLYLRVPVNTRVVLYDNAA